MPGMCRGENVMLLSLLKYMLLGGETSGMSHSQQKGFECVYMTKEQRMFPLKNVHASSGENSHVE